MKLKIIINLKFMREHFLKLKSNLELNPDLEETISTKHKAIRDYIKNNNPSVKDSKLIGSIARKTRIHPGKDNRIDIDVLVIMGEFYDWVNIGGISPGDALDELHRTVFESERYKTKNPVQDEPTIKLTYDDNIDIELVPAYVDNIGRDRFGNSTEPKGRGYWVVKNNAWEIADYDHEADYISEQNRVSDGYLIPTIKILKALKRNHFSDLGSFPLEVIASNIIPLSVLMRKRNNTAIEYHDLIEDFLEQAPVQISEEICVPNSKSNPTVIDPLMSHLIKDRVSELGKEVKRINSMPFKTDKVNAWKQLFGEHFPVSLT